MLILRSSPTSPFGRKIKIAIAELGLEKRIEVVPADTNDPAESLRRQNPLGKVPTLVFEDGSTLFDSRVIAEYLDQLAGGGRLFPVGEARFAQLRLQALADGICDAGLLQVYEVRLRAAEMRSQSWTENQARLPARLRRSRLRRRSTTGRASARSRSPAPSAISTCASKGLGAPAIRGSLPGSTASRPRCRPSRRRASRARAVFELTAEPSSREAQRSRNPGTPEFAVTGRASLRP